MITVCEGILYLAALETKPPTNPFSVPAVSPPKLQFEAGGAGGSGVRVKVAVTVDVIVIVGE